MVQRSRPCRRHPPLSIYQPVSRHLDGGRIVGAVQGRRGRPGAPPSSGKNPVAAELAEQLEDPLLGVDHLGEAVAEALAIVEDQVPVGNWKTKSANGQAATSL